MVRDDVEHLAEAGPAQRFLQPPVAFLAAQFDIDPAVIDHVVAVGTALRRLQIRGAVQVTDTQFRQVLRLGCRIVEGEATMQLHAIGRRRFPPFICAHRSLSVHALQQNH